MFTKLTRIIVVCDFSLSLFKHKGGILHPLTKSAFLLEDYLPHQVNLAPRQLLLAKYLISVATTLITELLRSHI